MTIIANFRNQNCSSAIYSPVNCSLTNPAERKESEFYRGEKVNFFFLSKNIENKISLSQSFDFFFFFFPMQYKKCYQQEIMFWVLQLKSMKIKCYHFEIDLRGNKETTFK